jgi:hypothetical protein
LDVVSGDAMEEMTEPLSEKSLNEIPPSKVEVAVVEVAMKYAEAILVPPSIPPENDVVAEVLNLLLPLKVFPSLKSVVEDTVMELPRETAEPLMVMLEFASWLFATVPDRFESEMQEPLIARQPAARLIP